MCEAPKKKEDAPPPRQDTGGGGGEEGASAAAAKTTSSTSAPAAAASSSSSSSSSSASNKTSTKNTQIITDEDLDAEDLEALAEVKKAGGYRVVRLPLNKPSTSLVYLNLSTPSHTRAHTHFPLHPSMCSTGERRRRRPRYGQLWAA